MAAFAVAMTQGVALSLPLLSQRSIDELGARIQPSFVGTIGLGFILVTGVSALTGFVSTALALKVSRRAARRIGKNTFDRLARQSIPWFSRTSPSAMQGKVVGLDIQYSLVGDIIRVAVTVAVTLSVGLLAFLVVSPWLAVPGLIGAVVTICVDLLFNKSQLSLQHASVQTLQKRAALNYDLLTQLPLLARFGALARGRVRYASAVASINAVDSRLSSIKNWRSLTLGLIRSADSLIFVTLAALLMARNNYTLGAFVALGAYKDLVAQSLLNAFSLRQRIKQSESYRLLTRDLLSVDLEEPVSTGIAVTQGHVDLSAVSFAYGTFDRDVLRDVTLTITPGQFVVVRGESGIGKSTIARLLCGSVVPKTGRVMVDHQTLAHPMSGFGSVLQDDRLISGSIRDNVLMFRQGYEDDDVYEALEVADLYEFVKGLPMKLNSHVSEHSSGLSGGQRQRLLIARAVLGRPKLIVLDEATASLEVEREKTILQRLQATCATLVVISHRPEVWLLADRIVEIIDGELHDVAGWRQEERSATVRDTVLPS